MKRFLLISAFIELLAGTVLFFFPHWVPDLAQGPGSHMAMSRMFGAAILGLGIFGMQAWRYSDNQELVKGFLISYLVFHIAVTIALFSSFIAGVFANPAGAILHLILAFFTGYFLFKKNLAEAPGVRKVIYGFGIVFGAFAVLLALLPNILHQAGLHPSYQASKSYDLGSKKALVIATNHGVLNAVGETTGKATGVFASEMTIPYYEFLDAGMQVDVASIEGGEIPVDPQSFYYFLKTPEDRRFEKDEDFQTKVKNSLKIDTLDFTRYDVIWMAGGWGAAYDLGQSQVLGEKISEAYYAEKPIIGSVCHGALGLISAKDTLGNYLITGRSMTGVTDKQIKQFGITLTPLHPETELRKRGVNFKSETGRFDFLQTSTVVDEEKRFVTGQNQNSGYETAQTIMSILTENTTTSVLD